jgi:hypothetical protein
MLGSGGNEVAEQSTHDPMVEGSNPGASREKIEGNIKLKTWTKNVVGQMYLWSKVLCQFQIWRQN